MNRNNRFYLKAILAAALLVIIGGYTYYQSRNIRDKSEITITEPHTGENVATSTVDIIGKATNVSAITLNDSPIFVDEKGAFKERRVLLPGYNAIKIHVEDKFKRITEKIIELVYEPTI